jgi:hypothetical protein
VIAPELRQGKAAHPSARRTERDHRTGNQLRLELIDAAKQEPDEIWWQPVDDLAYEGHGRTGCPCGGEERSEVGVGRDDRPPAVEGQPDDLWVGRSSGVEVSDTHQDIVDLRARFCAVAAHAPHGTNATAPVLARATGTNELVGLLLSRSTVGCGNLP